MDAEPATSGSDLSLPPATATLIADVRIKYQNVQRATKDLIVAYIKWGVALVDLRALFPPRGGWIEFCKQEFDCSQRHIDRVMALGKKFEATLPMIERKHFSEVSLTFLYELTGDEYDDVRLGVVQQLSTPGMTEADIKRVEKLTPLRARSPEIAQLVDDDRITLGEAEIIEQEVESAPQPVAQAIVTHAVTNPDVCKQLSLLYSEAPDTFAEVDASGYIQSGLHVERAQGGESGVPLANASPTDLDILREEEETERFLRHLAHKKAGIETRYERIAKYTGTAQEICDQLAGTDGQLLVVVYQIPEGNNDGKETQETDTGVPS